jgi:subtilisin family serine protease
MTVGIVDSGVNANHPDLAGAVTASVACIGTGGDDRRCNGSGDDSSGHGTAVAGLVAGRGIPGGMAGVAPGASLLAVRVLNPVCLPQLVGGVLCRLLTNSDDVNAGIRWAVDHGAQVVNVSIEAVSLVGLPIGPAVQYAWAHGVDVVAATGNQANLLMGPGYDGLPMVTVTAVDRNNSRSSYANNVGQVRWGIAAPGGETVGSCPSTQVLSTTKTGYGCWWGTSFAAPQVSGALALLRAMGANATQAAELLAATAQPLAPHEPDPVFGYGLLSVGRAVSSLPTLVLPGGEVAGFVGGGTGARASGAPSGPGGGTESGTGRGARSGGGSASTTSSTALSGSPSVALAPAGSNTGLGGRLRHFFARTTSGGGMEPWAGMAIGLLVGAAGALVYRLRQRELG